MYLKSKMALCAVFFFLCVSAQAQYYPLKMVNYTAGTNKNVHPYIILMAQDTTTAANYCVLKLTYDPVHRLQVASLVPILDTTNSKDYSYRLDSLQGYDKKTKSVTILIPNTISGRCMVSLNYPLFLPSVLSGNNVNWVFQDPNVGNTADVNYDIIFDKFEFTYNQKNILYIDPTAVDFFSIPIGLKSDTASSGPQAGANRDALMKTITNTLNRGAGNKWNKLVVKDSGTILRIDAPYISPYFDTSYLSEKPFNYIDTLIGYYSSHTVRINCNELRDAGEEVFDKYKVSPAQDSGAYLFTSNYISNGLWVFQNNPASGSPIYDTVNMNAVRSSNFFGPGTYPFLTTNKTVISVIIKNITAAFTVGLLPAPDGMTLDSAYLNNTSVYPYYKSNKQLHSPAKSGPWYNLYTHALHNAIPQIYAFAFDDVLGQSGTLVSSNNQDTISVILGDMGKVKIPAHSDLLPVVANVLTYNSGFVHVGSNYIDTLKWSVPAAQPANAQYFFMGSGSDFTITPKNFLSYQFGHFYSNKDSVGWIIVPDSLFSKYSNLQVPMAVYTCGSISSPCPANSANWRLWTSAVGSNVLPSIDSAILPVKVIYNSGFVHVGNNYIDTLKWSVPAAQPANAQYFFMGSGSDFTITPKNFLSYQFGHFYSNKDSVGWIIVPDSLFSKYSNLQVPMAVYTCGSISSPCPANSANWKLWTSAVGSNVLPGIDSSVFPVKAVYNSGFTLSGNNYVDTVRWTVPPGQPSTAQYFFMGSGPGFTITPDSFVQPQLNNFYSGQDTTGIITIPASLFNNSLTKPISIQVMTCGGPGYPCPTASTLNLWGCGGGSNIVAPATQKAKK